jgi:hypothetical protein
MDLFLHESGEASLFCSFQVPLDDSLLEGKFGPFEVGDPDVSLGDLDHPVLVDHNHPPGVFQKGGDVRGEEVFAVAFPDDERTASTGSHQEIGIGGSHHHQRQGTVGALHDISNRLGEWQFSEVL